MLKRTIGIKIAKFWLKKYAVQKPHFLCILFSWGFHTCVELDRVERKSQWSHSSWYYSMLFKIFIFLYQDKLYEFDCIQNHCHDLLSLFSELRSVHSCVRKHSPLCTQVFSQEIPHYLIRCSGFWPGTSDFICMELGRDCCEEHLPSVWLGKPCRHQLLIS